MNKRKQDKEKSRSMGQSFPAIAPESAFILILGSYPGVLSLKRQRYYAHPRNGFWSIMAHLLGFDPALSYQHRLERLKDNHIALWDVMYRCKREGSLDTSIESDSIIINDFRSFFLYQQDLKAIFFNGARAENEFAKRVLKADGLPDCLKKISLHRLPSSSPAMASLSITEKIELWKPILNYL